MTRKVQLLGAGLALLGGVLWAVSGTCGQYLFQWKNFDAQWVVTVRLLCAGVIMLTISFLKQGKHAFDIWKTKKDRKELIIYGIIGMLGVQYTYFLAIQFSNATTATVLQYMAPPMIMLYMLLRLKKGPTKIEIISVILALVGIFLLVTHGNINALVISESALFWGLLSAVALAFYSIYPKRMLNEWGTLLTNGWGMLIGGCVIGLVRRPWEYGDGIWDMGAVLALLGVIIFGTILSFFCYLEGVRLIGPTKASIYACIEPVSAALIGIAFLNLQFVTLDWIGSAMIIATAILLSLKPKEKEKEKIE